jgi:outer membrane lipoprotein-sorting protein
MINGDMTMYQSSPNNQFARIVIPAFGVTIEEGTDGVIAWRAQGPQYAAMEGPELKDYIEGALFNEELALGTAQRKAAVLGMQNVNGVNTYVLEVATPSGEKKTWFVDAQGDIIRRVEIMEGGEQTLTFSDFRTVDGVRYPFATKIEGPQNMTMQVSEIKHNVDVSTVTFARSK